MTNLLNKFVTPRMMEAGHLYLTALWIILIIPSAWFWKDSVPYLVAISVYAVITGHISSWQAARVERLQDDDANVEEVLSEVKRLHERLDTLDARGYRKEYGTDNAG